MKALNIFALSAALVVGVTATRGAEYTSNTTPGTLEALWQKSDISQCRRASTVTRTDEDALELLRMEVVQDEIGDTVHPFWTVTKESLKDKVVARKDFMVDKPNALSAEICVFSDNRLEVTINGHDVSGYPRPYVNTKGFNGIFDEDAFGKDHKMHHLNGKPFREYWQGGWERIPLDPGFLKKGMNTVIMRAADPGRPCNLLIEPCLKPNRSAVSRDGGKTWDFDHLSRAGNINGEYVARLMLEHYPEKGWIMGEPIDLWRQQGSPVAIPAMIKKIAIDPLVETPWGTDISFVGRLGSTPVYAPDTWTAWEKAANLKRGRVNAKKISDTEYRYMQWKAILRASGNRKRTPVLKGVTVTVRRQPIADVKASDFGKANITQSAIVRPSHPFVHASKTKRLQMLKDDCKLEEVVKGKKRGIEQLLALAKWIKKSDLGNRSGKIKIDSSWDGLEIWHTGRGKDNLAHRMCTHRAALFVQCATALGYPARVSIWSHAVAEVCPGKDHSGWVVIDPSDAHYVEVDGVPASHFEAAMAWDGTGKGRREKEFRRVWGPDKKSTPKSNKTVAWHTRFWVHMRNNYLESSEPAEQGHGSTFFKYDGYLRLRHPQKEPLPWFSFTSDRKGDFDFTMDTVNLHLAGESEDRLCVQVESTGPNVDYFEASFDDSGKWEKVKSIFQWPLKHGANSLIVRSVNTFGISGQPAEAKVLHP